MSYFFSGLWHFACAMAWACALGAIGGDDALLWLRHPEFSVPLVVSSSAFFFIPEAWAKKGLLKFLHYPLPDWDVLLLGPASHRNWLFHSPLLPALLVALAWRYPILLNANLPFTLVASGFCVGVGSHLFWDCVGSRSHKIVVVPYWFALREAASRVYLLAGAALCLAAGVVLIEAGTTRVRLNPLNPTIANPHGRPHGQRESRRRAWRSERLKPDVGRA